MRTDDGASLKAITVGVEEATDRCCRAPLAAGRTMVVTDPGVEMFVRDASLSGSALVLGQLSELLELL